MKHFYNRHYNKLLRTLAPILAFLFLSNLQATAQLAGDDCKFLGNIVANSVPINFNLYWNQITPENSGKWGSVEASRNSMTWTELDRAYKHAIDNGFPFKHHTFVWGNQQPNWIENLSLEEQKEEVEEWIRLYSERYPETAYIDVVNEPLHAMPKYRNALGGSGTTGYDWIIWSFEKAREYLPNAKLLINDYGILNSAANTANYLNIIKVLQERDLIDGIGVQSHGLETFSTSVIKANLDKLAETGLPIYVSEYEVERASDEEQLRIFKEQFTLFWTHKAVKGITLWGYEQGKIWKADAYLIRSNGAKRPAMVWLEEYLSGQGLTACGVIPTGIKDLQKAGIEIFPNPVTNGRLTFSIPQGITAINILSMDGQSVKSIAPTGGEVIETNLGLPSGIYIVQMVGSKETLHSKIVVR